MNKLLPLTLSALLFALSSACSRAPHQITEAAPVAASSGAAPVAQHRSGLIKLGALARLPKTDTFAATPGYPGKGFHMGTIGDAATLDAVIKAGGWKGFGPIDWGRQRVVYLILDAQTNALEFKSFKVDGSRGTLTVEWSGIEPFYVDATPAVVAVVSRDAIGSIDFAAGNKTLGTIRVP